MAKLVFIHGLNTFGDDDIHIGPLRFGLMHAHIGEGLTKRGVDFFAATKFEGKSPYDEAESIFRELERQDFFGPGQIDLLGHSAGGLSARILAARPEMQGRVRNLMTFGTPHHGTIAADLSQKSWIQKGSKFVGYANPKRTERIHHLRPSTVAELNQKFPKHETAREISFLCEVEPRELCLPLMAGFFHLHPRADKTRPKSDGLIWSESQLFGEVIGPFAIDHMGEMGFFPFISPKARRKARAEFDRLLDAIAEVVSKQDESPSREQDA